MIADIILKIAGMQNEKFGDYHPRPSSAGQQRCIRQMVYHGMGVARDRNYGDRMAMVFDDGHWHEELSADWIRKSVYQLHSEQMSIDIAELDWLPKTPSRKCRHCNKTIPNNLLHGHIDYILTDPEGNDFLCDHKAINHFTFQRFWKGDETPDDYFAQLAMYYKAIKEKISAELQGWNLLIKNKNTAQYMEYIGNYDTINDKFIVKYRMNSDGDYESMNKEYKDIYTQSLEKFKTVQEYITKKTLPRRQYYKDTWRCEYCLWKETCWEGYEEEKTVAKKLPETIQDGEGRDYKANELVSNRMEWKSSEKIGKKDEKVIKDYMRLHNIDRAETDKFIIIRTLTKTGDRFKFKPKEVS